MLNNDFAVDTDRIASNFGRSSVSHDFESSPEVWNSSCKCKGSTPPWVIHWFADTEPRSSHVARFDKYFGSLGLCYLSMLDCHTEDIFGRCTLCLAPCQSVDTVRWDFEESRDR